MTTPRTPSPRYDDPCIPGRQYPDLCARHGSPLVRVMLPSGNSVRICRVALAEAAAVPEPQPDPLAEIARRAECSRADVASVLRALPAMSDKSIEAMAPHAVTTARTWIDRFATLADD